MDEKVISPVRWYQSQAELAKAQAVAEQAALDLERAAVVAKNAH